MMMLELRVKPNLAALVKPSQAGPQKAQINRHRQASADNR
jgi:hypothetical protein